MSDVCSTKSGPELLGFPLVREEIQLHRTASDGAIIYVVPRLATRGRAFAGHATIRTEGFFVDVLAMCDGATPIRAIKAAQVTQHGSFFGSLLVDRALKSAVERGLVVILPAPATQPRSPRLTGDARSFQPLHLTLEVIETCNFACDHCYYASSPDKKGILARDKAIAVMDQSAQHGVRVIELTGGECTIHPAFRDLLNHAAKNFDLVAIITNGYRIGNDDGLADYIASFPNVVVQVSIDGTSSYHDRFRKHKNAFDSAVRAIEKLVARNVMVRLAMTVTDGNSEDIVPVLLMAKKLGVAAVAFAPVAALGRGCNVASDPGAGSARLYSTIHNALAPYKDDPLLNTYSEPPELGEHRDAINCGAGWRTFAVDFNGMVRACNYSRDSKKFGNISEQDYTKVFGQRANYLFRNAPSPGGAECMNCKYYFNCKGCFVKAFMLSEAVYPECPWRRKWFPDMSLGLDQADSQSWSASRMLSSLPEGDKRQYTACTNCGGVTPPPDSNPIHVK